MQPSIGVTTQIIRKAKWYKYIHEFGLKTIEINRQNSKLHFDFYFLDKVKRYMHGFDLSLHSGTTGIFQPHETFTKASLSILAAEIDICRFLGASQLVFHLYGGFLSPENKKRLAGVMAYARDAGVEMLYESNSTLVSGYAYDVLESFPDLGYVLDLGHLNNGHGSGKLGCAMDEFVRQVRSRVVYLHASNNSGKRDEHKGLGQGTLDWRGVLDMLDLSQVSKIIIEVRHSQMVQDTRQELEGYLDGAFSACKLRATG